MAETDPLFPPLITGHAVRAPVKPFAQACRLADDRELGAGDLVWARDTSRIDLALVLEPEVSVGLARQMLPLMMVAVGDCLGALMPPQVAIQYRWPDGLLINGGLAGHFQLAMAPVSAASSPDWLVVGCDLQLATLDGVREPGETADRTSITEEGGGDLTRSVVVQSLAAHLLTWLHTWQDDGFRNIAELYMGRLEGRGTSAPIHHAGRTLIARALGLDDAAGLIVKPQAGPTLTLALADALCTIEHGGAP